MSATDIAAVSGIADTLIRRLLRPPAQQPARIHRTTAEAVLGIPLTATARPHHHPGLVPADRAAVYLQELSERGWPTSFLAHHLATSTQTIALIRDGRRQHLRLDLNMRILRLYSCLIKTIPAHHGIPTHSSRRATAAAHRRSQP